MTTTVIYRSSRINTQGAHYRMQADWKRRHLIKSLSNNSVCLLYPEIMFLKLTISIQKDSLQELGYE